MAERFDVRQIPVDRAQIDELQSYDVDDLPTSAPCLDEDHPPAHDEGPCAKCAAYLPLRGAIRQLIEDYQRAPTEKERP